MLPWLPWTINRRIQTQLVGQLLVIILVLVTHRDHFANWMSAMQDFGRQKAEVAGVQGM
jgi:hypothetical protein